MDYIAAATADLERLDETIRRAQETITRAIKEREEIAIFLRLHERYAKGGSAPVIGRGAMSSKAEIVRAHFPRNHSRSGAAHAHPADLQ